MRPNNYKTRSIPDNYNYCDKAYCAYCDHFRIKKYSKPHRDYSIQPVHAVAKEIAGYPFQRINHCVRLSQVDAIDTHNSSDYINEYSLSSSSEQEYNIKPCKHKKLMRYIMHKLDKRIRREYASVGTIKHEQQQYPSKSQLNSPYQVFITSSCQTKNASTDSESHSAMQSNSLDFWELLLQKIKYQVHKAEVSKFNAKPCDKDSCQFNKINSNSSQTPSKPKTQTKHSSRQSSSQVLPKKKSKDSGVFCKCPKPNKSRSPDKIKSQDAIRPCQEEHDALKKTLADKYNGEILCIHNPPCVLINGCLNLPPPKSSTPQGPLFYPVTRSKKSSFAQLCRKIKRSKQKSQDQAIQYQPPTIDLEEYLPEFRTEKIVQSLCNHNPPCEVVRGCHKTRFNPTLQTSCVHVPMCPKFPECVLEQRNIEERNCNHTPKCAELPLCTRKYITLTAKENAATQVKPKTKIGCRHQPPCLMIPKCLAQVICGDWYPGNTIPGCVHQPSCEMIPACFRKQFKESVSVQSQYPSASCQIV
ncbi:uncharacterized protein [Maniola hyperantus]|uniref:uncharacterized protein n=1 Tax=Aphantopus hyperantus TaxID=2795564 RepID=UPI003748B5AB